VIRQYLNVRFLFPALLILVPLLVYSCSLTGDFLALDDELLIIDNPTARGLTLSNITEAFTSYDPELYIPFTLLTYQLEYSLFELNPLPYHATNLLFHILNGLLVFAILKRLLSRRAAFLCALLFALHPLNVEGVAWASGRKDVLSAFFFLLSYWLYFRSKEQGKGLWKSLVAFACGLLSKVSVFPLPFILLLTDWVRGERIDRSNLKRKAPYFVLAALFLIVAFFGKHVQVGNLLLPLLLSFVSVPFYLWKFVLPIGLSIFYPFTTAVSLINPQVFFGLLIVIAVTVGAFFSLKWTRRVLFAWLFFLIMLAPSFLNVMKGGEAGISDIYFASDRYVYLASIGLLSLVGLLITRKTVLAFIGIALIFGALTYRQSLTWQSSEALFQNVIKNQRHSHVAYNNLAGILVQNGEIERAVELYEQSIGIRENSRALFNLAQLTAVENDRERAIELYERGLVVDPTEARMRANLGGIYLMRGDVEQAYEHLIKASEDDPRIVSVHYNLGLIYEHWGQADRAKRSFQRVLELDPHDEQARVKLGR